MLNSVARVQPAQETSRFSFQLLPAVLLRGNLLDYAHSGKTRLENQLQSWVHDSLLHRVIAHPESSERHVRAAYVGHLKKHIGLNSQNLFVYVRRVVEVL